MRPRTTSRDLCSDGESTNYERTRDEDAQLQYLFKLISRIAFTNDFGFKQHGFVDIQVTERKNKRDISQEKYLINLELQICAKTWTGQDKTFFLLTLTTYFPQFINRMMKRKAQVFNVIKLNLID